MLPAIIGPERRHGRQITPPGDNQLTQTTEQTSPTAFRDVGTFHGTARSALETRSERMGPRERPCWL